MSLLSSDAYNIVLCYLIIFYLIVNIFAATFVYYCSIQALRVFFSPHSISKDCVLSCFNTFKMFEL